METVALDTSLFLSVANRERGWESCRRVLERIEEGGLQAVLSTVVLAELSVGYFRTGRLQEKTALFARITAPPGYRVVPVTAAIADRGGEIRAKTGLALPDALILATALEAGAGVLLTDDREFKNAGRTLRVVSPRDFR